MASVYVPPHKRATKKGNLISVDGYWRRGRAGERMTAKVGSTTVTGTIQKDGSLLTDDGKRLSNPKGALVPEKVAPKKRTGSDTTRNEEIAGQLRAQVRILTSELEDLEDEESQTELSEQIELYEGVIEALESGESAAHILSGSDDPLLREIAGPNQETGAANNVDVRAADRAAEQYLADVEEGEILAYTDIVEDALRRGVDLGAFLVEQGFSEEDAATSGVVETEDIVLLHQQGDISPDDGPHSARLKLIIDRILEEAERRGAEVDVYLSGPKVLALSRKLSTTPMNRLRTRLEATRG